MPLLLILAPHRQQLEVWQVPYGHCLAEVALDSADALVLCDPYADVRAASIQTASSAPAHDQACWLVNMRTGEVHDLTAFIVSTCLA